MVGFTSGKVEEAGGEKTTILVLDTLPKFNSSPLKSYLPNRKGSSSNHYFSGAMLNFGGVYSGQISIRLLVVEFQPV